MLNKNSPENPEAVQFAAGIRIPDWHLESWILMSSIELHQKLSIQLDAASGCADSRAVARRRRLIFGKQFA